MVVQVAEESTAGSNEHFSTRENVRSCPGGGRSVVTIFHVAFKIHGHRLLPVLSGVIFLSSSRLVISFSVHVWFPFHCCVE